MRWLTLLLLVFYMVLVPVGTCFATSPSIDDVKVYTGYEEEGDWLIVFVYNISGSDVNTSRCDIYNYNWKYQLIDSATGTVYTNGTFQKQLQCGMRPCSIYISADFADTLVWQANYSVKLIGQWGSGPNTSKVISTTDWKGDIDWIDEWVRKQADTMQDYDSADYLETTTDYGEVLTIDGGLIFDAGIPYLSTYKPDLFIWTEEDVPIEYEENTDDLSYAENLYNNWDDTLGPDVSGALTSAGWYFGIGGRMMGAVLTILGFIALALIEKSIAFMIILGGVLIGVFPMLTVIMLVFILGVMLIRSLFWSST